MTQSKLHRLTFSMLSVFLLVACQLANRRATPRDALGPGDTTRTLAHDSLERSYIVHVPPDYDPAHPTPLVIAFHGGGGNAKNIQRTTGLSATADAQRFIVAYPNGTGPFKNKLLTWNGGTCCGYAVQEDIDDVRFVEAMIEDLAGAANIDRRRIYATGMSNGAMMSYRLACELSGVIAAIGPVAATQNIDRCEPKHPVPVIHFHGDGDQHAPYQGGIGAESLAGVDFAPVEETIAFWVDRNGCTSQPRKEQTGSIVHTLYTGCDQDATVELYAITGGLHAWPGGEPGWRNGDEPTQDISANDLMWAFFESHSRP